MHRGFVASVIMVVVGCSSETGLVGNGACDGFCTKVEGASCTVHVTRDDCIAKCVYYQTDETASRPNHSCSDAESKMIRCAMVDGNVGCDGSTGMPRVVGCDPYVSAREGACVPYFTDGGAPTGP